MTDVKIEPTDDGVAFDVKVVPNARSDAIVGPLGEALKVRVAAAPEAGKANKAVCRVIAEALGVNRRAVVILAGAGSARKRIAVVGLDAAAAHAKLHPKPG